MINDFTERLSFRLGIIFFLALAFYLVALSEVWAAGSLSLSPTTQSGTEFTVQVNLDTGTDATIETDLLLTYDPAILNIDNVTFGQLYPNNVPSIDNSTGKLSTFSYFSGTGLDESFTGSGVLATILFSGVGEGVSTVSISCTASVTNDSNIIKQGVAQDILDCLSVVNGSYTVTAVAETGTSPTPNPTVTVAVTRTPTPTLLPTTVPTRAIGSSEITTSTPTPTPVDQLLDSGSVTPTLTLSIIGGSPTASASCS